MGEKIAFVLNLDLLIVGITVAASLLLGALIYYKNSRSVTNLLFLILTVVNSFWSILNYLAYKVHNPNASLWITRFVMFFAVYQAFSFFMLMYVFPKENMGIPRWIKWYLLPTVILISAFTLTPYVFSGITLSDQGIPQPIQEPGILAFALVAISLVLGGIGILIKKQRNTVGQEKLQFRFLSYGVISMFVLIVFFNFFLVVIFNDSRFIPLSAVFTTPFILLTFYAIVKHQLLDVKVIGTELFTFLLVIATFFEVLLSNSFSEVIFRVGIFSALLLFSLLLIRSMIREVAQRHRLEDLTKRLAEANDQLKELDKIKDEFVYMASHELRTPMTAIKNYLWLALNKHKDKVDGELKTDLDRAYISTQRLIGLVQDMLTVSRIEGNRLVFDTKPLQIGDAVKQIVDELSVTARDKHLNLIMVPTQEAFIVRADQTRIMEVVQNLIGNSLKFTPAGGSITVSIQKKDGMIETNVSDTGVGIPKEDLPRLFQKFGRLGHSYKRMTGETGTGLGLFISKQIIEALGGRIWATSEVDHGSTFTFSLPEYQKGQEVQNAGENTAGIDENGLK